MAQTADLIEVLKLELRKKQITYQDIAEQLGMSEASIKRMFSQQHFTMD